MNIQELQHECFQNLKKSDSLSFLKEVSAKLSKEEFLEFSNVSMLDAYRANRVKAVEYMLSFYEKDEPKLLIMIHLQTMLYDEKGFEKGKKMLVPLARHFSTDLCQKVITQFVEAHRNKINFLEREKEMQKIIFPESLQTNEVKVKRIKI
jgi:hypothetical protein